MIILIIVKSDLSKYLTDILLSKILLSFYPLFESHNFIDLCQLTLTLNERSSRYKG